MSAQVEDSAVAPAASLVSVLDEHVEASRVIKFLTCDERNAIMAVSSLTAELRGTVLALPACDGFPCTRTCCLARHTLRLDRQRHAKPMPSISRFQSRRSSVDEATLFRATRSWAVAFLRPAFESLRPPNRFQFRRICVTRLVLPFFARPHVILNWIAEQMDVRVCAIEFDDIPAGHLGHGWASYGPNTEAAPLKGLRLCVTELTEELTQSIPAVVHLDLGFNKFDLSRVVAACGEPLETVRFHDENNHSLSLTAIKLLKHGFGREPERGLNPRLRAVYYPSGSVPIGMTAQMTLTNFDRPDPPEFLAPDGTLRMEFGQISQQAAHEGRAQMLAATGGVIVTPLRQALLSVRRLGDRDAATSRRQHYMFDTPLDARDVADSRNAGLWP